MQCVLPNSVRMNVCEDVDMDNGSAPSVVGVTSYVRKPTYVMRKEEKESLLKELDELQAKLKALEEADKQRMHEELQLQLQTSLLRSAVQQQQLSLVSAQSAVSAYVTAQESLPYEATLHLGSDFNQRRDTLVAAKRKVLLGWLAYSTTRTRFLDPFRPFSERTCFLLDSGDYCSLQLESTPLFTPNRTVQQVFDKILENHESIDMRITDAFDDITTCDEIDYGVDGIRQCRFSSRLTCGVDIEMNVANFHQYFDKVDEEHGGGPVGVFTADFVDHDELYPYRSAESIRHDISGVLVVQKHTRKRYNPVTRSEEKESAIVITQLSLFKFRRTEMPLTPIVEHQIRDHLGRWGSLMISAVIEEAYGFISSGSTSPISV